MDQLLFTIGILRNMYEFVFKFEYPLQDLRTIIGTGNFMEQFQH